MNNSLSQKPKSNLYFLVYLKNIKHKINSKKNQILLNIGGLDKHKNKSMSVKEGNVLFTDTLNTFY